MKTYTPELDPAVLGRLRDYALQFADDFPHARPAQWASVYLQGLLLDGERKSVEPLSRRVSLPGGLAVKDPDQALDRPGTARHGSRRGAARQGRGGRRRLRGLRRLPRRAGGP